ncbi:MAG: hypothetical protein Q8M76_00745, partial [Spirochaetaceae bacterium]|nr:hypothetical protein [Spirochaetaceae bacterium]
FCLMNTSVSFGLGGPGYYPVTKNLLGLQFGLSTLDLGIKSPATVALGLAGYIDSENRDHVESGSFVSDLGCILAVESLSIEALLQDIFRYSQDGAASFAGPTAEYKLRMKTKLILDIFFMAGLGTTRNIPGSDFLTEFQMYRFFFSRSLRTGIDLGIQNHIVTAGLTIPGQSYGFTIAYFLPELPDQAGAKGADAWSPLRNALTGVALNARAMVMITNDGDRSTASPVLSLGLSRFF